jgi:hypothetical protein
VRPYRVNRSEEEEIREDFSISHLEFKRRRVLEDLEEAMALAGLRLSLIRTRIAELEATPFQDFVRLKRQVMDGGSIQIWVTVDHVPILDGQPSFDDGEIIDHLSEEGRNGTRSFSGVQRHEALWFAEKVARDRGLHLYFTGFQKQKITPPEGIVCWGLPS